MRTSRRCATAPGLRDLAGAARAGWCCARAGAARALAADPRPGGTAGLRPEAEAYAAAHAAATGAAVEVAMRQRLFRLVALVRPDAVPGACRVAGAEDIDLLARWQSAFAAEAVQALGPPADPRPGLLEALGRGAGFVLWERDGEPVAYASARRPLAGMSRIGPVYTPPEHRGHGYGSAATAAASAWAQRAGAREVCLFTDLANPVSNAIYPRLGYRTVHDAAELRFLVPDPPSPWSPTRPASFRQSGHILPSSCDER